MSGSPRFLTLNSGPKSAKHRLILAHGAGTGMTSPFLEAMTALLTERGVAVVRFEFGYMAAVRDAGKRRPPPKVEILMDDYRRLLRQVAAEQVDGARLLIGGKSMGGRIASMIADAAFATGQIAGLVCLGYPFHPPGKPRTLRTAHLGRLGCPTLIVQGERDPFGDKAEIAEFQLSGQIALHWAADGDHDLKPRAASGCTHAGNLAAAANSIAAFATRLR